MAENDGEAQWKNHALLLTDPKQGLWRMMVSPLVAGVHFAVCYIGTSVYCIRSDTGDLTEPRVLLAAFTVATLAVIALSAWGARQRLKLIRKARRELSDELWEELVAEFREGHSDRRAQGVDKERNETDFLARITLYLAILSWVGVLFVSTPLIFIWRCA